jgi:hypothetical protein
MSSPIVSATVEKKVLNFSETSHVSFIILLSSHRIIFWSPELHFLEKNGYNEYQNAFKSVLDKHAPVKNRQSRKNPLPCMNSELRGAIYRKHMFYSTFKGILIFIIYIVYILIFTVAYMCQLHVKRVYMMYIIKHCNKNSYTGSLSTVKTKFKPRPIYFRWLVFVIYFISKGFFERYR